MTPRVKDFSDLSKRDLLQGALISAIAAVQIKIPHQIRRQKVGMVKDPTMLTPEWWLHEMLRIMKDVWRCEIVEGTSEYELAKTLAEINCNTHNMQQRMMEDMTRQGTINTAELRARYGL